MVEPVVVWNNYAGSFHGYESSPVTTVHVPDALWNTWPDSTDFPGTKTWFGQFSCAFFDSGPFLPSGLILVSSGGGPFKYFGSLRPTSHGGSGIIGAFGNGLIDSQTIAFQIQGQGGDGQLYQWAGLNLILTEPVPGTPGYLPPPPPPVLVPVPVVHALGVITHMFFGEQVVVRRQRSFAQVVG